MEIRELISKFEENFREYYKLLHSFGEGNFSYLPSESSWDIRELLEVLADLEDEIIDFRLKKILEEEHPYLPKIRLERIKQNRLYRNFTLDEIVNHILQQRKSFLQILYVLPHEQWERTGVHEDEGHIPFRELVRRMVVKDQAVLKELSEKLGVHKN